MAEREGQLGRRPAPFILRRDKNLLSQTEETLHFHSYISWSPQIPTPKRAADATQC